MASLAVRTATGAGLAVAATALLWLDGLAPAGVVPLAVGGALAVLGAWELARMERLFDGRFAREVLVASVLSVAAAASSFPSADSSSEVTTSAAPANVRL